MVLGTPGSGKSYAIVNNYIKRPLRKPISSQLALSSTELRSL